VVHSTTGMCWLIVQSLRAVGFELDKRCLAPCLLADWEAFEARDRHQETFCDTAFLLLHSGVGEMSGGLDRNQQHDKPIAFYTMIRNTWSRW
jgi:hypothetical protein